MANGKGIRMEQNPPGPGACPSGLTALDKAGAVRRHNIERHLETLGFDAEALTKAH